MSSRPPADSFGASFQRVDDAVAAAIEAQLGLRQAASELKLLIRMGIHAGEAAIRDNDYSVPR